MDALFDVYGVSMRGLARALSYAFFCIMDCLWRNYGLALTIWISGLWHSNMAWRFVDMDYL
jgi:hypothetical protein